jgi:hypothetical protein
MVWWIGGPSNKAPPTFGNVFENQKAVGDDTLANAGWLPPGVRGSCPFLAKIRRVSNINGQIADPKFVLSRRDLHAPGGHSYLPPLKLIGIPAFFFTGEISPKSEIQNSKLQNGEFLGISIVINRENKGK